MSRRNRDKRCPHKIAEHRQKKSRICLCCIVKDDSEAHLFKRMLNSFMPYMDGLAVAITGLSGKHERLCQLVDAYGGTYLITTPQTHAHLYSKDENGNWFFANFGESRNISFQLADRLGSFDWLSWADADDVLMAGEEIQLRADYALAHGMEAVFFPYWCAISPRGDGTFSRNDVDVEMKRERLLRAGRFIWVDRIHEAVIPIEPVPHEPSLSCDYNPHDGRTCVWAHLPETEREDSEMRNLPLLELQRREEMESGCPKPRTAFYLGQAYASSASKEGHSQRAEILLREFLTAFDEGRYLLPEAWGFWASFTIANLMVKRGDSLSALAAYQDAEKWFPGNPLTLLKIAHLSILLGRFDDAKSLLERVNHPSEIGSMPPGFGYPRLVERVKEEVTSIYFQRRYNCAVASV